LVPDVVVKNSRKPGAPDRDPRFTGNGSAAIKFEVHRLAGGNGKCVQGTHPDSRIHLESLNGWD
jgi:hypothetical protein